MVSDPAGTPIANVLVIVDGPDQRSARTENGRIAFENLPTGLYRLRFERDGFVTLEREIQARAGAPIEVKVTLTPQPAPPPPPPAPEPAPAPAPPPPSNAKPAVMDLPTVIEKNYIGRENVKSSALACAGSGAASLIQVKEQLTQRGHDDSDEFLYIVAGDGTAQIAGRVEELHAGVLLMVPRAIPHTLAVTGRRPLVILAIRAGVGCGAEQGSRGSPIR